MTVAPLPTVFIPHGGGPCFFMDWTMGPADTWDRLAGFLRSFEAWLGRRPDAIVVVSGHHETPVVELTGATAPPLLFDYYGFPPHTYDLSYPASGSPALVARMAALLEGAGVAHRVNPDRGFDHGVFVPFLLMFPDAAVPIVQLSLRSDLDAAFHLDLGAAIAALRQENVLVVGSGMSYHNMATFMSGQAAESSGVFDQWLTTACTAEPRRRRELLEDWSRAPRSREAHPREEHLLPLMVAAGAAGDDPGTRLFTDEVMGATVSAYAFGR